MSSRFSVKRIYDQHSPDDGVRVLVDRVWPRGVAKKDARIDAWLKEVAPSSGLRKWFGHDPGKWDEFRERYAKELDARGALVGKLRELAGAGRVSLLFAAKDVERNNAVALKAYLEGAD